MTTVLIHFLYALTINKRTQEPKRFLNFILYYVIGFFVAFIVFTMVLLCLEVYNFPFVRQFIYRQLGEPVLFAIEAILF